MSNGDGERTDSGGVGRRRGVGRHRASSRACYLVRSHASIFSIHAHPLVSVLSILCILGSFSKKPVSTNLWVLYSANLIPWGGRDEQSTTSAAVDSVHPHAGVETVLERVDNLTDDHPEIPRRTLPAWGQKKTSEEPTQAQSRQLRTKIELDSNLKPVVVQTNLNRLTDSWAIARPACKGNANNS